MIYLESWCVESISERLEELRQRFLQKDTSSYRDYLIALKRYKGDAPLEELTAEEIAELVRGGAFQNSGIPIRDWYYGGNLQGSHLQGCLLHRCDLSGANLRNCDMTGATFEGATLDRANMREAHLKNALFHYCSLEGADLSWSLLESSRFHLCSMAEIRMVGSNLNKALFTGGNLTGASFDKSDLRGAIFDRASLHQATFVECLTDDYTKVIRMPTRSEEDV